MMIQLGEKIIVKVEKLSLGGDGIARKDSFVIFIPYSVAEDELEVEIVDRRKTFARGKILKVLKPGPARIKPLCPHFFEPSSPSPWCGGCDLQQIHYQAQLEFKAKAFKETIEKISGISPKIETPIGMLAGEEWRYRNKTQVPFAKDAQGKVIAGFFSPSSHTVVPLEDCFIHSESMVAVIKAVVGKMNDWKLEPYSEKTHSGWLRHLLIRQEIAGEGMLVTFVTSSEDLPKKSEWIAELTSRFPKIQGICQNINPDKTNVIVGKSWRTLYGNDFLLEILEGLKVKVSAGSFFQVNTKMAEKLYGVIRTWALGGNLLFDLYCGVGCIGLLCAPLFEQVAGADSVASSISDAEENARLNKISNCRFFLKNTKDFLRDIPKSPHLTVVADPPRAGMDPETLKFLAKLGPEKIIYVSCDPGTLARDIKFLSSHSYRVDKIQLVDLFPQSSHIESVTLLIRS